MIGGECPHCGRSTAAPGRYCGGCAPAARRHRGGSPWWATAVGVLAILITTLLVTCLGATAIGAILRVAEIQRERTGSTVVPGEIPFAFREEVQRGPAPQPRRQRNDAGAEIDRGGPAAPSERLRPPRR